MKALVASLIMVILASGSAEAFARLTVCNDSKSDTLRLVLLYPKEPFEEATTWMATGWEEIKPGACQHLLRHEGKLRFGRHGELEARLETFLAVRQKARSGQERIIHPELGPRQDYFRGAERFFCVQEKNFYRVLRSLNQHESCPSEWSEQLFNFYVKIPGHIDYKLHLGDRDGSLPRTPSSDYLNAAKKGGSEPKVSTPARDVEKSPTDPAKPSAVAKAPAVSRDPYDEAFMASRSRDHARARSLFGEACKGGDAKGCFELGFMFGTGMGGPLDQTQARVFYEHACTGGDARGCLNLGFLFSAGKGGPQDSARAQALYEQACKAGESSACSRLKTMQRRAKSRRGLGDSDAGGPVNR